MILSEAPQKCKGKVSNLNIYKSVCENFVYIFKHNENYEF